MFTWGEIFSSCMWNYDSGATDPLLNVFLNILKNGFANVTVSSRSLHSVCFAVEDYVNGVPFELWVRVDTGSQNRESEVHNEVIPPCFTIPYSSVEIPVQKASTRSHSGAMAPLHVRWDSSRPDLVDATRQAFGICSLYWGNVVPPSVGAIMQELCHGGLGSDGDTFEPSKRIERLLEFPNELELFTSKFPIKSEMRAAGEQTLKEVEKAVAENERLREMIKNEQEKVASLQLQLQNRLSEIRGLEQNELFVSLCTPEAVQQTLKKDVLRMEGMSRELARAALNTPTINKRAFESALDRYRSNSTQLHLVKLKLMEYEKQLLGSANGG